jgi:hypothetical protein
MLSLAVGLKALQVAVWIALNAAWIWALMKVDKR